MTSAALIAAGYLQQVPAGVRALADARTTGGEWRSAIGWIADGVLLFAILKSRLLPRVALWLEPRLSRPWLLTPALAILFAVAFDFARMLVSIGLATIWPIGADPTAGQIDAAPFHVLIDALLALIVVAAARRWPGGWWARLACVAALLIAIATLVFPMTLPPAARGDRLAPSTPTSAPLLAFAQKGGLRAKTLYVFESADPADVDAEGLGPFAHLAVSRAALDAPTPQTYAAIGHLLGHHRRKDLWSMTALVAALSTLALALVAKLTRPLARVLGAEGIDAPGDLAALPVMALILWAFVLLAGRAFDAFDRGINYRADAYALSLTHDPQGFARWLIQAETKSKADPAWLEMVLFYDHPPLKARLVRTFADPAAP